MSSRRAFGVLWMGQFATTGGLTVFVPLLPFYLAELGTPKMQVPTWTAVTLAAPAVAQMLTGPLWGWIGDRYGRKAMVVRAQAGLAVALALMCLAETPEQFLLCRVFQGACGGVVSATAAFASATAEPGRRGSALGTLHGATAAGSLAGPLLGSLLADSFGFTALLAVVSALTATAAVLAMALLREPPRCASAGEPAPLTGVLPFLLRGRSAYYLFAGLAAQTGVYALVVGFAPQVARTAGSVADGTLWVGILQSATWAAALFGGPWWGRRNDLGPPRRSLVAAVTGCAVAVALQGVPADPELLLPLRLVQGFCCAAVLPSVLQVVCLAVPENMRGACIGVATSALELGQVVGPPLGAAAVLLFPPAGTFAAIGGLFVLSAAAVALSPVRHPVPVPDLPKAGATR
ncbi:MFS transporter [Saccharopolyspora taberi]|uniref:MFS transporter n=1 Tax=Saccharopolyspora taberi TaxID=60895 RepID=A0ABN3V258_9PSEU